MSKLTSFNTQIPNRISVSFNDEIRIPLDNGFFERTFISADPILTYEGKWVVPCLLYDQGMQYIDTDKIQLFRRRR